MANTENTTPRVYVGTYAKYNNGSIAGAWLDLDDYSDRDEFYEACAALHSDEHDPSFMFQDYEGFPASFYCESDIPAELFDWIDLDDDDREILAAYHDCIDEDADIDRARDAFMGTADSEIDWAEQFIEDTGMLQGVPEIIARYFDYEAYARDARLGGDVSFCRYNGTLYVFDNC